MGRDKVILSSAVYFPIINAAVQCYKKECFGLVIGRRTKHGIEAIFAERLPQKKEKYSSVEIDEKTIIANEYALKGTTLEKVGDFHSHTDHKMGKRKYEYICATPGKEDVKDMEYGHVHFICAVNRSKRKVNHCSFNPSYIKHVVNGKKGKLSLTLRAFCLENGKVRPMKIILTEELEKELSRIRAKTSYFQKKIKERENLKVTF